MTIEEAEKIVGKIPDPYGLTLKDVEALERNSWLNTKAENLRLEAVKVILTRREG